MTIDEKTVTGTLLRVTGLAVRYGAIRALHGVSLTVPTGSSIAIVGANGAGKSTLMKAVSGLVSRAEGAIEFDGVALANHPDRIVASGIAQVPEGRRIFGNLTVVENLLVGAHLVRDKATIASRLDNMFDLFPRLRERRGQYVGTMSGGEQQMVAIARALMSGPRLLLLDEPSLGLAPLVVAEVFRILDEIKATGVTVVLVEQNSRMALRHTNYAYVLERGSVAIEGPSASLQGDPRVQRAYLGGGVED